MNNEKNYFVEEKLDFNWDMYNDGYKGPHKLLPNLNVIGNNDKLKCFSRESYAQDLFDLYNGHSVKVIKKDLQKGDCISVINIVNIKGTTITIELLGGLLVDVDLNREKKLLQIFGYNNAYELISILNSKEMIKKFIDNNLFAYIMDIFPNIKISLWEGYLFNIKNEFVEQINNPTKAYTAKVIEVNKGGFFVETQGLRCFLPGSLAAPNKIIDFQTYLGKEIIVMVEDFLVEMNSFIVSHKKYLAHILPQKIQELDVTKEYTGSVTGFAKWGVFIEFDEYFTGMIHISKMCEETKKLFEQKLLIPGTIMKFYIEEINKKDKKIILCEDNINKKIQDFVLKNNDKILSGKIENKTEFGVFISIENEKLSGLIPLNEFKKYKLNYNEFNIGEQIKIILDNLNNNNKLLFKLKL